MALAHEFRFRLRGDLLDEASDHHWTTAMRVGIIRVDEHEADNSERNRRRSGKGRQATIQIDETREACGQHGERSWKQDASGRVVRQLKAAVIPRRDEGATGNPRARLPLTREYDPVRGECGHTGSGVHHAAHGYMLPGREREIIEDDRRQRYGQIRDRVNLRAVQSQGGDLAGIDA